jgi:hypothetical protein
MPEQNFPPCPDTLLDFTAAIETDAAVQFKRLGFDDKFGRKRLADLIHEAYVLELMAIAQVVRWFEIGLVTPHDLNIVHPTALMIDLRQRIATSPQEHVRSPAMDYTLRRMVTWWQKHTITSAWRSLKAHVQVPHTSHDLADAVADLIWNTRHILTQPSTESQK